MTSFRFYEVDEADVVAVRRFRYAPELKAARFSSCIVVDNTLPRTLVRDLRAFWHSNYPDWTIRHENEIAKASTTDSHWIGKLRQIEKTGAWLIITSDVKE